jgi:hypothetical protein
VDPSDNSQKRKILVAKPVSILQMIHIKYQLIFVLSSKGMCLVPASVVNIPKLGRYMMTHKLMK